MGILKKLRKKAKGVVTMTPFPIKECQDYVPFDSIPTKDTKELKELLEKQAEEEQFSSTPKEINKFEEENPGKHAIWRGNFTKQFKVWAGQIDSKD